MAKSLEPNRAPRGAMKDRRVPVADDAVRLTVGPDPGHKYPEGADPRPGPARKGQEILKVSARVASRARKNQTPPGGGLGSRERFEDADGNRTHSSSAWSSCTTLRTASSS